MKKDIARWRASWSAMLLMLAASSLAVFIIILLGTIFLRNEVKELQFSDSSKQTYSAYYALVVEDTKDLFWQNVYKAAKEEARKQNVFVELAGEGLMKHYPVADKFKMALASKVDGIMVVPQGEDIEQLQDEAAKEGVPVVTLLDDSLKGERQSFVGVSSEEIGQLYAESVQKMGKTEGKVMIVIDAQDQVSSKNLMCLSISEALSRLGLAVEVKPIDRSNAFSAEEIIRDIIISSKKTPDILICLNTEDTLCAYQAVIDYNQVGNVAIMGYYQSDAILEAISKGIVTATLSIDAEEMGRQGVEALSSYRNAQQVNAYFTAGVKMIDKDNVALYQKANEKGGQNAVQ